MKKKFYAIFLTAMFLMGVMTASAFGAIVVKDSSKVKAGATNIGALINKKEKVLFSGQEITEGDAAEAKAEFQGGSSNGAITVTTTINPGTSGLTPKYTAGSNNYEGSVILTGTVSSTIRARTTYTVKYEVKQEGSDTISLEASFDVLPKPTIDTSKKPGDVTWGEEYSFTPSLTKGEVTTTTGKKGWSVLDSAGSLTLPAGTTLLTGTDLEKNGLKLDTATGEIKGTWDPGNDSKLVSDQEKTATVNFAGTYDGWTGDAIKKAIVLQATKSDENTPTAAATDTVIFPLTFRGVAPTLTETASEVTTKLTDKFYYNEAETTGITVKASGPGKISWDVKPATGTLSDYGLEISEATVKAESTLTIKTNSTKPQTTVKNMKLMITAKNANGKNKASIEPTLTIGIKSSSPFKIYQDGGTTEAEDTYLTNGDKKVGEKYDVKLVAKPGPVKWTATNLPDGVALTVDKNDSTKATISGTYKSARKDKKDTTKHYSIKAVNENFTTNEKTLSNDLMVWAKPEITSATLFKKNVIETGEVYNFEVTANNMPDSTDWVVTMGGTTLKAKDTALADTNRYKVTDAKSTVGTSYICVDSDKLDNDKLVLTGSLDRVPAKAAKVKVVITAENPAGTDKKEYEITVKGKAPALKKEDLTLSGTTAKDIKVTAGDAPITLKAYIDAKNAEKLFGVTDAIDLTKTGNVAGLTFSQTADTGWEGKATIAATAATGKAYSKLPVTVEATNADISDKTAKATYTVTIAATNKPSLKPTPIADYGLTADALPEKKAITVEANKAITSIVLTPEGDGPLAVTVKPLEKNGLTATKNDSTGVVTIAGTPEATKKDVVTKFTIEVKNPSTGDSAKSELTITAKPVPVLADKELEATVLVGKKVKITPKATVAPAGMTWQIASTNGISGGSASGAGQVTTEDQLKELYGLEFDTAKGTISGTAKAATGKDTPIEIKIFASSDVGNSPEKTAKITILGAKPKLTTKKLTVIAGETLSDVTIDTNLKGKEVAEANVTFSPTTLTEALAGVTVDTTTTPNVGTLTGQATSATKKQTVEFTLDNYGTEAKGKVSFMVVDPAPTINGATSVTVDAGASETEEFSVSNSTNTATKYKWKISKKPKGVSAKIKGNGASATLTVKAGKKAKSTEAELEITVTDPLTKETGTATVAITVNGVEEETEAAPLEVKDVAATPEAKTETKAEADEKVLGEGEVHMGAERTADKLTAQQRKFFEDEGYVIAAVLPEIEVTAAGQYDFEVDLDKEVETGAELVWFAFASKPTTDDEIVDFADEKGKETKVVPESHVVIVAPWLNAETKYAPVIAVKAAAKDADATTVEGVKEAAEAKTEE